MATAYPREAGGSGAGTPARLSTDWNRARQRMRACHRSYDSRHGGGATTTVGVNGFVPDTSSPAIEGAGDDSQVTTRPPPQEQRRERRSEGAARADSQTRVTAIEPHPMHARMVKAPSGAPEAQPRPSAAGGSDTASARAAGDRGRQIERRDEKRGWYTGAVSPRRALSAPVQGSYVEQGRGSRMRRGRVMRCADRIGATVHGADGVDPRAPATENRTGSGMVDQWDRNPRIGTR